MTDQESLDERANSDDATLCALTSGDPLATAAFVRDNIEWMLSVARRLLRDVTQSEDAVQNAFVNIFKGLSRFEGRSTLKTWMHRIVVNEALAILRKNRRRNETSIEDLLPEFDDNMCRFEEPWGNIESPEALVQKSQVRTTILDSINKLPDSYRIVLVLRDIEELSTAEVAATLDLSETNVKVRLHRARSALKRLLEPLMRGKAL